MSLKSKTASLTSATAAGSIEMYGKFNASIQGTFVATVALQRSYDNSTWETVSKDASGSDASFTAPCSFQVEEVERGVFYRWNCTAYTSGTINTRISQ